MNAEAPDADRDWPLRDSPADAVGETISAPHPSDHRAAGGSAKSSTARPRPPPVGFEQPEARAGRVVVVDVGVADVVVGRRLKA